jgi:Tfp pilus assembly protein PilN
MMQIRLNLATSPYFNRRTVRFCLLAIGFFLILILALNLVYAYQNYRQYQQVGLHLSELDKRLSEAQGFGSEEFTAESYALAVEQVAELNRILEVDQFRWTGLLSRLEKLVPDSVRINSIQPDFKNRSLQIVAVSRDVQGMTDLLDALLASPDMNQVFLQRHQEVEMREGGSPGGRDVGFSLKIEEAF